MAYGVCHRTSCPGNRSAGSPCCRASQHPSRAAGRPASPRDGVGPSAASRAWPSAWQAAWRAAWRRHGRLSQVLWRSGRSQAQQPHVKPCDVRVAWARSYGCGVQAVSGERCGAVARDRARAGGTTLNSEGGGKTNEAGEICGRRSSIYLSLCHSLVDLGSLADWGLIAGHLSGLADPAVGLAVAGLAVGLRGLVHASSCVFRPRGKELGWYCGGGPPPVCMPKPKGATWLGLGLGVGVGSCAGRRP